MWLIIAQSAINPFRDLIMGEGKTEKEAWLDAVGEGGKKHRAWFAKQVTDEEYDEYMSSRSY
jgi:hypothetical protein